MALFAGSLLSANAQSADNVKAFVKSGTQKQLAIMLKNDVDYTAFQMTIKLPSTMSFTDDAPELSARQDASHQLKYNKVDAQTMKVVAFSADKLEGTPTTGNLAFKNDRNVLLLVGVAFDGDYRDKTFDVSTITLQDVEFVKLTGLEANKDLTVKTSGKLGDGNNDNQVNVADIVAVANYINLSPASNFDLDAANVNLDIQVNVADIVGIANVINDATSSSRSDVPTPRQELDPQ